MKCRSGADPVRAIIIEEKDCRALLDRLKLEAFDGIGDRLPETLDRATWQKATVNEIHRKFHYHVVHWLQDQGASCIRGG